MKIGIFTNNYLPNPYGVTQSVESFRKQLEKRGHSVFIFAPFWKEYQDENPNACPPENFSEKNFGRVFRYPSIDIKFKFRFPLAVPYSRKMDKILKNLDLDIIHSQHPNLLGTAAAKWARKKNIPLIFTWHTLYDQYAHFAVIIPEKLAAWWAIRNAKNYANNCDQIIVPTGSVRKIIMKWGVVNKNIEIIPSGVEEETYQNANRSIIRNEFSIKENEILLLLVSRLTSEKNVEFLFRAVIKVLCQNENAKFLVAGDGYLVSELKAMAKENNLEEKIIFAGIVDKKEIKNYYAAGDIFVYASKSETQGMIVSEAMYMGLPIVAVDATGSRDLIENEINGFLVAENEDGFSEAVSKLIDNKILRKKFSEASIRIAREKFTDQVCAEKLLKVYEKAIMEKNIK
jgi:1,2-diacylglycerol 3-alpha-glucosyltransferase